MTKILSKLFRALVHEVIPVIDILTQHLDKFSDNLVLHPSVHAAAARGRIVLNKYYSRTDRSMVYRIAMGMYLILDWQLFAC